MKKIVLIVVSSILIFTGCNKETEEKKEAKYEEAVVFGTSIADLIEKSDIDVLGTTTDAIESGTVKDATDVGTLYTPDTEKIIELDPDVIFLSSKYPKYEEIVELFSTTEIDIVEIDYNSYEEYKSVITQIAEFSADDKYYDLMVSNMDEKIEEYKNAAKKDEASSALVLRTSSSTLKAVDKTYFANEIIEDMNIENIANVNENINANLSIEYIVELDPEFIFIIPMGDVEESKKGFDEYVASNPAWSSLTAVKNDKVFYLPKELFHNKPNDKWSDAYAHIEEIKQQ